MATISLSDNKTFDEYATTYGWVYDNGGRYADQDWDWYFSSNAELPFNLLRQSPARVVIVRFEGLTPVELWSGEIQTSEDFDRVMDSIKLKT